MAESREWQEAGGSLGIWEGLQSGSESVKNTQGEVMGCSHCPSVPLRGRSRLQASSWETCEARDLGDARGLRSASAFPSDLDSATVTNLLELGVDAD